MEIEYFHVTLDPDGKDENLIDACCASFTCDDTFQESTQKSQDNMILLDTGLNYEHGM